jgi:hypothetical protein
LTFESDASSTLTVRLTSLGKITTSWEGSAPSLERSIFVPTREVLSIFPGFIAAYLARESSFDRTYYDLCVALDAKPLRGPRDEVRGRLLDELEPILGGTLVNDNGRFYLRLPDGLMEVPLVGEGLRKLAMLVYLVINGSLTANSFLFWDEPEASLNPRLARAAGDLALGLADDIQVFLATHDYVLTSELALSLESRGMKHAACFALGRSPARGTVIERGETVADLQSNPILQAFADLHRREDELFDSREPARNGPDRG